MHNDLEQYMEGYGLMQDRLTPVICATLRLLK